MHTKVEKLTSSGKYFETQTSAGTFWCIQKWKS